MNESEVRKVMAAVSVYWPRTVLYPPGQADLAVEMWRRTLGDLDSTEVLIAVELLRDEPEHRAFAPTVGAIRARATEMLTDAAGHAVPMVGEAWQQVQRQIAAVGYVGVPTFEHPAIGEAVRALGWMNLCMSTNADVTFAHFRDVYKTFAERSKREQVMPPALRGALDDLAGRLSFGRLDQEENECSPLTPIAFATGSKPSGREDRGPVEPSGSGDSSSSRTTSTPPPALSIVSETASEPSRPSPSGARRTQRSPEEPTSTTTEAPTTGVDLVTVDEPSSPTSSETLPSDLVVAASLGARLAKAGKPRHEVLELMSGYPDAEVAAAVDAWVAAMPERRRYENVVYQVDHVRPEDGQVFTVKVHQNGFVTGLRADFPADVWRSAELVDA